MIKIKANVSFTGAVTMRIGEERTCEKTDIIRDLINCGHVTVVEDEEAIEKMTKKELAEYCEANNIQFDEKMTKKELLDTIEAADSAIGNEDNEVENANDDEEDEVDAQKDNEGVENETE